MIEKLETKEFQKDCGAFGILVERKLATPEEMQEKINELVDVVNELQLSIKPILEERASGIKVCEEAQDMYDNAILDALKDKQVDVVVEPADQYAEQRKWIGKLCWFWDIQEEYKFIGILGEVADNGTYFQKDGIVSYLNCEPVKPDDDIIYKGGNNE